MRTLSYASLPLTNDPRQVFTLDMSIGGSLTRTLEMAGININQVRYIV